MKHTVDARGLTCPLPVVNTKNEIAGMKAGESVEVLVDNEIAVQNLSKFAHVRKHRAEAEKLADGNYRVVITVGGDDPAADDTASEKMQAEDIACTVPERNGAVVVISSDHMGEGAEALGKTLMKSFLFALTRQDVLPDAVLLYNSGAFLSCEGSDSVEDLRTLEAQGVEILTCGTCLNFYEMTERLAVGSVTNMYDIAETMSRSSKIIRP